MALLCDEVFLDGITSQKRPGHMELARWCDMFIILPASADVLGQAANGLAPNLLGEELVESMLHGIERHRDRVIESSIDPHTRWNPLKSPAGRA